MIHRLLVTGKESDKLDFHLEVCLRLNGLATRPTVNPGFDTTFYTCVDDDVAWAIEQAKGRDLTVEAIEYGPDPERKEVYKLLHLAAHGHRWEPPTPKRRAQRRKKRRA